MANTYTQIYIHGIFAVQYRQHILPGACYDQLQKYVTGIVTNMGSKLIEINNMPDHVHILIGLKPDVSVADMLGNVKSGSSAFINENHWVRGKFEWQKGYGAFSHSRSQLSDVITYIRNQQDHHSRKTFQQEYIGFMKEFGIEYDEKYLLQDPI